MVGFQYESPNFQGGPFFFQVRTVNLENQFHPPNVVQQKRKNRHSLKK